MPSEPLIVESPEGLYCPPGDFYVDPWKPVARAIITHAHGDHARWGSKAYLASQPGIAILRRRMGPDPTIEGMPYGTERMIGETRVSFHPAGHLLGSAQVRIEHRGETWVVSGDYKTEPDRTCAPFEVVPCHTFLTESTFALPVYRWKPQSEVFAQIQEWWKANQAVGQTSIIFAYALGKAQRILAALDPSIGPILVHGAVDPLNQLYRDAGIALPPTQFADAVSAKTTLGKALVIAPPSARGTPWLRKFQPFSAAFASGWMQLRGARRRRALDRGFILSDHADWPALLATVARTGARNIGVMHGNTAVLSRYLREQGYNAWELHTHHSDEAAEEDRSPMPEAEAPAP